MDSSSEETKELPEQKEKREKEEKEEEYYPLDHCPECREKRLEREETERWQIQCARKKRRRKAWYRSRLTTLNYKCRLCGERYAKNLTYKGKFCASCRTSS